MSILDARFILSFSSSVSILLVFFLFVCLFISFLLWISIIVRQKLAERKIRNSKSKEKGGGERQALENLAVYTATSRDPLFLCLSFWSPVTDSLMPPSTSHHHPSLILRMMMKKRQPPRKRQQECSHLKIYLKCSVLQVKWVRSFRAE